LIQMLEFVEVAKDSIAVRRAKAHQRTKQKNKTAHEGSTTTRVRPTDPQQIQCPNKSKKEARAHELPTAPLASFSGKPAASLSLNFFLQNNNETTLQLLPLRRPRPPPMQRSSTKAITYLARVSSLSLSSLRPATSTNERGGGFWLYCRWRSSPLGHERSAN